MGLPLFGRLSFKILSIGPLYSCFLLMISMRFDGADLGDFRRVVGDFITGPSDFIHGIVCFIVGMRLFGVAIGFGRTPRFHPYRWLRPDLVPPAPFLQWSASPYSWWFWVLANPAKIDEEFRKAWLCLLLSFWVKEDQP